MSTVLILGAGTSMAYGYPSGADLVEQICEHLRVSKDHENRALLHDLQDHKPYSIDAFLKKFPQHDQTAKAIIAEILYRCEKPDQAIPEPDDLYGPSKNLSVN